MNLWEAIKALEEGERIRRTDWPPDKYLQIKDGKYVVNEAGLCSSIFITNLLYKWEIIK